MQLTSQGPHDTQAIAAKLAAQVLQAMPGHTAATIITLRGDLGAGKTTFTQGFAHALGVTQRPKSPTFLLAKQYAIPKTNYSLWHLDCYRLTSHKDLAVLDLHHLFTDPANIILIEWPENVGDAIPREHMEIHFAHAGGDRRDITIATP